MKLVNPITVFQNLPKDAKNVCFLRNENTITLAWNPVARFLSANDIVGFKKFAKRYKDKKLIGFLGYDLAYKLYNVRQTAKNDLKLPNIFFLAFDSWQEFKAPKRIHVPQTKTIYHSKNFRPAMSRKYYTASYKKVKKYIQAGDIYQMNLTHRLEAETDTPSRELFTRVISENPVNFWSYIEGDDFAVLSASPERFVHIQNETIETCPVKGTRSRGKTKSEDEALKKELLASDKEAAELSMITDLLRNDIGKISQIGTVKVAGHRLLSKCPTVWHTYSQVTGKLKVPPLEALLSMLPGGSITGCPKKRAIEIIDELEPTTRGIYTGVIGQVEPKGEKLDFSIAIRTIIQKKKKLYLQVGGGIVIDSTEKAEFAETLQKAASFMNILC